MNEYGPFDKVDINLYAKQARHLIKDINSRNKIAIVEGGSQFYLRSLFEGKINKYHDQELYAECKKAAVNCVSEGQGYAELVELCKELNIDDDHLFMKVD